MKGKIKWGATACFCSQSTHGILRYLGLREERCVGLKCHPSQWRWGGSIAARVSASLLYIQRNRALRIMEPSPQQIEERRNSWTTHRTLPLPGAQRLWIRNNSHLLPGLYFWPPDVWPQTLFMPSPAPPHLPREGHLDHRISLFQDPSEL